MPRYILHMTAHRFTIAMSIIFGVFALYTAIFAFVGVLRHPDNLTTDALRFGSILISMIFGLALLLPRRFIPVLRRVAEHITPAPVKLLSVLLMCVCLLVANLSGATNIWLIYTMAVGFIVAFVYPGLAFRNISIIPSEEISLQELSVLVGEKGRKEPKFQRGLFLFMSGLWIFGIVWAVFARQAIPTSLWASLSGWIAILAGGFMAVEMFRRYLNVLPENARRRSLPKVVAFLTVIFGLSIFGYRTISLNLIPTVAAYFWGEESTQNAIVMKSSPNKRRKMCHGWVEIRTATGELRICNLSREFLESLSQGDMLILSGQATNLGQTIETLRRIEN